MTVTRVLQRPGTCSVELEGAPTKLVASILRAGEQFGSAGAHLVIFPTQIPLPRASDLPLAVWMGFVDNPDSDGRINAVGVEWWLDSAVTFNSLTYTRTLAEWSAQIANYTDFVSDTDDTSRSATAALVPWVTTWMGLLDSLVGQSGSIWRLTPDGRLQLGSSVERSKFGRMLIAENVAPVEVEGPYGGWRGTPGRVKVAYDDSYVATVVHVSSGSDSANATELRNLRRWDGYGKISRNVSSAGDDDAAVTAAAMLNLMAGRITLDVEIDASTINPLIIAQPGDEVGVFDPIIGLADVSTVNTVNIGGMVCHPQRFKIAEMTCPVSAGLGVAWWPSGSDEMVDLTPYVRWETSAPTIKLSSSPRDLRRSLRDPMSTLLAARPWQ